MQKNKIIIEISPNNRIELRIPTVSILGIWKSYTSTLYRVSGNNNIEVSRILLTTFDRPLLLLLSESKNKLYCLYDFDIEIELIVFDIDSKRTNEIPKNLERIVKSSEWNVRRATRTEVYQIKSYITNIKAKELRERSNPTLDIGFFKYYLSRNRLINLIDSELRMQDRE